MQHKEILERIYYELLNFKGIGKVADYIPALSSVSPDSYGISLATLDGEVLSVGDSQTRFTVQSISKVFTFSMAIRMLGDQIWNYVGREPSGTSFNSLIQLELERGLPGKSGVEGGIVAVIPGKLSIAVWSPELNSNGNSIRGIETLERFTTYLGSSVF